MEKLTQRAAKFKRLFGLEYSQFVTLQGGANWQFNVIRFEDYLRHHFDFYTHSGMMLMQFVERLFLKEEIERLKY